MNAGLYTPLNSALPLTPNSPAPEVATTIDLTKSVPKTQITNVKLICIIKLHDGFR